MCGVGSLLVVQHVLYIYRVKWLRVFKINCTSRGDHTFSWPSKYGRGGVRIVPYLCVHMIHPVTIVDQAILIQAEAYVAAVQAGILSCEGGHVHVCWRCELVHAFPHRARRPCYLDVHVCAGNRQWIDERCQGFHTEIFLTNGW